MSTYTWTIYVDNIPLSNVIDNVDVQVGSSSPLDQPMPATANIEVLGLPVVGSVTESPDWYLGRIVEVTVAGTFGNRRLFYGRVIQQTTTPIDGRSTEVITELSCQSFLDRLQQISFGGDGLPEQTEYERIYASLENQFSPAWADLPSTMTWADIPTYWGSDITWAEWEDLDNAYMPFLKVPNWSPGDPDPSVELEAYAPAESTLLDHAINLAMGTGAILYEYFSGLVPEVWYIARLDRGTGTVSTVDITDSALSMELAYTSGIWDIATEVEVYNSTLRVSDANIDATKRFGFMRTEIPSMAKLEADLQTLATTKVTYLSRPLPYLSRITFDYERMSAAERVWGPGAMRQLVGVPDVFGGTQTYEIVGIQFRGTRELLTVEWTLLAKQVIFPGPLWRDVPPADTWNDLLTTWEDWI